MDIFKFRNPTNQARMEQGEIIDGFKSKMWIERYRDAGEFTLVASIDSGIREKLPIGTFISHVNTKEIMIVENHSISDNRGEVTDVTITGRGLESFLDQRIVNANRLFPSYLGSVDHTLDANYTWIQAIELVEDHVLPSNLVFTEPNDAIPYLQIVHNVVSTGESVERSVRRGDSLFSSLLDLLSIDNLGIKIIRPGPGSPLGPTSPDVAMLFHKGVNRSSQIVFSYDTGEIESSDYLWSNKKSKNSVLVSGRWVEIRLNALDKTYYNRRIMYVDASDIDESFESPPTEPEVFSIISKMEQRGIAALASQKDVTLAKVEPSKESVKAIYRQDYDVGDLIMVSGNYNQTQAMRVSEFVEIEDENGNSAYPTLSIDEVS